jgi:hypothetical protein
VVVALPPLLEQDGAMNAREEYEREMGRQNFVRAVMLAEEGDLGDDAVDQAQRAAIKQAVGEWFNFRGAEALAREWGVNRSEVVEICDEILTEFKERAEREGRVVKVFDIDQMDHAPVTVLIAQFRDGFR